MNIALYTLSGVILILLFFFACFANGIDRERGQWAIERKDLYDRIMCASIHDYDARKQAEQPKPETDPEEVELDYEFPDTSPTQEFLDMQAEAEAGAGEFLRM